MQRRGMSASKQLFVALLSITFVFSLIQIASLQDNYISASPKGCSCLLSGGVHTVYTAAEPGADAPVVLLPNGILGTPFTIMSSEDFAALGSDLVTIINGGGGSPLMCAQNQPCVIGFTTPYTGYGFTEQEYVSGFCGNSPF